MAAQTTTQRRKTSRFVFPLENRDLHKAKILFQPYQQLPPEFDNSRLEAERSVDQNGETNNLTLEDQEQISKALVSEARDVRTNESCVLYLPPSIQVQDGVVLENIDLNVFGAGLESAISKGTAPAEAAIAAGKGAITSLTDAFRSNLSSDAARVAATRVAGGFGSTVSGAVSSALRTTPNPNTRVIFKAVNLREFSFDFKLYPKSYAEAVQMENIIHFFRRNLYPKTIKLQGTTIPIAYRFPNKFDVSILYNDRTLSNDIVFEKMYLRGFNATYNPSQQSFYKGGHFQEVNISMNFVESRALTYDDIVKFDYPIETEERPERRNQRGLIGREI